MTVAAGHTHTAVVNLNALRSGGAGGGAGGSAAERDCVVVWEFTTASFDIAVSVHYGGNEVRPHARWPSHRNGVRDAFVVPPRAAGSGDGAETTAEPGGAKCQNLVTLKFDNTYSRLRPKLLRYRVAVVSRSEAVAVVGRAMADARLTGASVAKPSSPLSHVHMLLREDSGSSYPSESSSSSSSASVSTVDSSASSYEPHSADDLDKACAMYPDPKLSLPGASFGAYF